MSQEKVDKYKEYKANKQKIWKREKMIHRLELGGAALVCVAFLGWIGYSVYDKAVNPDDGLGINAVEIDAGAIDDYIATLSAE